MRFRRWPRSTWPTSTPPRMSAETWPTTSTASGWPRTRCRATRPRWGSFEMLDERSQAASKGIVESAAAKKDATGIEKLVGDLYATGMDEAKIEAAGIAPIKPQLDRIDALKTPADIAEYLREEFAAGRGEVFSFGSEADFKNSSQKIGYAFQGGLSLPEKAYYLEDARASTRGSASRSWRTSRRSCRMPASPRPTRTKQAKDVLAFETRLAKASLSPIERRDPNNQYHCVSMADADKAVAALPVVQVLRGAMAWPPRFLAVAAEVLRRVRQDARRRAGWRSGRPTCATTRSTTPRPSCPSGSTTNASPSTARPCAASRSRSRAGSACSAPSTAASAKRWASCTSSSTSRTSPRRRWRSWSATCARRSRRASRTSTG